MMPPDRAHPDAVLTASSVVSMGLLSLVGALARALTRQIDREVYLCWGAAAWIVCFGAPLGSLCLTPARQGKLRVLFYVVAVGQFAGFAALKMRAMPPHGGGGGRTWPSSGDGGVRGADAAAPTGRAVAAWTRRPGRGEAHSWA